ncbi:hypothetical protein CHARACLAT_033415 [Characodon lateralis]|uniref:Uncharacterized protein n=1 Tax=Characodon lateralis TaxID=208331 RepID=A0ABU7DCS2_9TELE|nr:hypothetical protein [Characodon lateralis]
MTLALGDFRAILGRSVHPSVAREIEQNADCSKDPDNTPPTRVMTTLGKAIRNQYLPLLQALNSIGTLISILKEHINAAVDMGMRHTGVNPKGDGTGMGQLFKKPY